MISVEMPQSFEEWRKTARELLLSQVPPQEVVWGNSGALSLFARAEVPAPPAHAKPLTIPKEFISLAETVSAARDEDRWELLYRLIYRIRNENPNLLKVSVDDDVRRAQVLQKSISRDIHKMHAFVRFKKVIDDSGKEIYLAWHAPEHNIIHLGVPFFVRRFGDKPWSIFTPDGSAHWDLENLTFTEGIPQHQFPHTDDVDDIWITYYKSIFNPARIKMKMMKSEMSPKYWASMPEAKVIYDLVRDTPQRLQDMALRQNIQAETPETTDLQELKRAASSCRACPIGESATQVVFGEGDPQAKLMIVGEQPGDQEDLSGHVFVGLAGEILQKALEQLGLHREDLYLTNAVKHFKWTAGAGQQRIHKTAKGSEMHACRPWLEKEIRSVKPQVILAL
ncbi:MAG: TIGR03915 family putative DNA repair protein, partial [Bdellovibrionales bacterium]|nr:TIGR03915 family putative DNA repair protein [Bdellovibrionales bacterium]